MPIRGVLVSVPNKPFISKMSYISPHSSPTASSKSTLHFSIAKSSTSLVVAGLILCLFSIIHLFNRPHCHLHNFIPPPLNQKVTIASSSPVDSNFPTNISHLRFGIAGNVNAWTHRRPYVESWWSPNETRGFVYLDREPPNELLPWPQSSPYFRVSRDLKKVSLRIASIVSELLKEENEGVRWYVMGDDDTIFFIDNLVDVLAKYDHTKYFYIGANSECLKSNLDHSFDMAFGGAGFALSYPLAAALARNLDGCISRYSFFSVSDQLLQACIAEFGISLTLEKGFHQIDLRHDISGILSAHPRTPLVSLHHLDTIHPIFPTMTRSQSVNHLITAAPPGSDRQPLFLQQTICHHKQTGWSFSISWGYSVDVYETIHPPALLRRPLETFRPWKSTATPPYYVFNTRAPTSDPCWVPHTFFFDDVEEAQRKNNNGEVALRYVRKSNRGMPACATPSGNHSADFVCEVRVLSRAKKHVEVGVRTECCDILRVGNVTDVRLRDCEKDESAADMWTRS